jgi:hypothetical protein
MLNILISLLIFTLPFEILKISFGSLDIRVHQILLALIVITLIPRFFKKDPLVTIWDNIKSLDWYYDNIHLILLSGMWLMILIGGIVNRGEGDLKTVMIRNIVLLGYILVFYIIYRYINTKERLYKAFNLLFISTGILILIGLYEAIAFQLGWNSWQVFPGRVDSLLPEPNWFGMWLATIYAISVPLAFYAKKSKEQFALWFLIFGTVLMSILSVTRASWLAIIIVTGLYILYQAIFVRKYIQLGKFSIILFAVIFGAAGMAELGLTDFSLKDRVNSIITQETTYYYTIDEKTGKEVAVDPKEGDKNLDNVKVRKEGDKNLDNVKVRKEADVNVLSRKDGYISAGVIIYKYIFTGVGLTGYENRVGEGYNTNNILLAVAVSGGIITISLFLSFLYIITKQGFLIFKLDSKLATILLGVLLVTLITGMFNDNFLMGFTWLIFGLIAAIPEVVWRNEMNNKS